jgi:outer membrane protein OmpA-like peptidoglycan-associated protein
MRLLLLTLVFLLPVITTSAQTGKLRLAQQKMDDLDYVGAIGMYNEILQHSDDAFAKLNLAEAYRKVNDPVNAEFWYGQAVRTPQAEPIHQLYYGMMLQRNGKCDQARVWYQQYVELVPGDQRGRYLLRACDYESELKAKGDGIYTVESCDFNSGSDDFSPVFFGNQTLVYCSERDTNPAVRRSHTWTGNPFLELFVVPYLLTDSSRAPCGHFLFGRPEKFSRELNSKFHDASVSFSRNGQEIYLTRNNFLNGRKGTDDDGIVRLKIYHARLDADGRWGPLQSLPFNSDEYSVAHPTLSPDGKFLYYASDMPGGFGGMDLYVSEKTTGRWGPPINLGPEINTEGHEAFPYAAPDGKLYFASDGHIGIGGLDLFSSYRTGDIWSVPINLGAPFNSPSDDFSLVFNDEGSCGFFASSRPGGKGGDDIYQFSRIGIPVEVFVYDAKSGQSLRQAQVVRSCRQDSLSTDEDGRISFFMKADDSCHLIVNLPDYDPASAMVSTAGKQPAELVLVEIPLRRTAVFDVEGIVFDGASGLPLEGALVTLEDSTGTAVGSVTTTVTGHYYFKLEKDSRYRLKSTREGFFAGIVDTVHTTGLTESETFRVNLYQQPVAISAQSTPSAPQEELPGGSGLPETAYTFYDPQTDTWLDKDTYLPANGTYPDGKIYRKGVLFGGGKDFVESPSKASPENPAIPYLLHIYYDFDQAYIRKDAIQELEKLHTLLVENPQYIIEIGSHTDARGSHHYNQRLSQRRAEAVVRWLVDKGVSQERLVAKGYGESVNVNDCINNVPCSEREHQMNRRTEFKVIGCTTCVEKDKAVLSRENKNVRVDPCRRCPF